MDHNKERENNNNQISNRILVSGLLGKSFSFLDDISFARSKEDDDNIEDELFKVSVRKISAPSPSTSTPVLNLMKRKMSLVESTSEKQEYILTTEMRSKKQLEWSRKPMRVSTFSSESKE